LADAIFISYRRDDTEGEAGRLFDDLTRAFGSEAVFMDVAGIKPGVDFRRAIEQNVASCGVLLAIVGPSWISVTNADGTRRLDDPNDFVALEIASAMRREVPVIPVLVHEAKMPAAGLLPESLKDLAFRNSVELTHARWNSDVALLIEALKAYVTPKSVSGPPVHATVPVQLPAPHPPSGTVAPATDVKKKPTGLIAGAAVAAVLVIAAIVYFATRPNSAPAPDPNHPDVVVPSAAAYAGTWVRTGGLGDADALGKLIITSSGSGLSVHAFGRCQTASCDWGVQPGTISGSNVVATFSAPPNGSDTSRTAVITAHPVAGGLDVVIQNNFQNPAGPRANHSHQLFASGQ
jgi:hypothetical protein